MIGQAIIFLTCFLR